MIRHYRIPDQKGGASMEGQSTGNYIETTEDILSQRDLRIVDQVMKRPPSPPPAASVSFAQRLKRGVSAIFGKRQETTPGTNIEEAEVALDEGTTTTRRKVAGAKEAVGKKSAKDRDTDTHFAHLHGKHKKHVKDHRVHEKKTRTRKSLDIIIEWEIQWSLDALFYAIPLDGQPECALAWSQFEADKSEFVKSVAEYRLIKETHKVRDAATRRRHDYYIHFFAGASNKPDLVSQLLAEGAQAVDQSM